MSALLRRATWRHLRHHPWQMVLAVLGVGLGVAVVVSIDLANVSAARAFELSSEAVTGRATHLIEGSTTGLPTEVYRRLRIELGVRAAPVVESYVSAVRRPGRTLRLLGLDPFAEAPFRTYVDRGGDAAFDLAAFLTHPGGALVSSHTAAELGLVKGDRFAIDVGGSIFELELVGLLEPREELRRSALADLLLVDVATAQEALALGDRLTRIDLIAPDGPAGAELLGAVRGILPPDARLSSSESRSAAASQMTAAFRLNLQALSLLALLCGAFLIYNTMTFAVVQRRPLVATLRALGATRRQILWSILREAALIGTVGVALGELAGFALGRGLVQQVSRTINDLYFVVTVRQVSIEMGTLAKGALMGLGATLGAALAPSWEASTTAPREALVRSELEARVHRAVPRLTLVGLILALAGSLLLLAPGGRVLLGLLALFAILVGLALLTPAATIALMSALTPAAGRLFGQLGRLATRGVVAALSRTGIAIAALMIALSVTVGVDLMIRSFRTTVTHWLEYTLPADLYVSVFTSPARRFAGAGATFDAGLLEQLRALPEVAGANALRHFEATVDGRQARAIAIELSPLSRDVFSFVRGDPEEILARLASGDAVIVSEPFAYRSGVTSGDRVELATPRGPRRLEVAGVFYDYSSEEGVVFLDRRLYRELWNDDRTTAISLHAAAGVDRERLAGSVRAALGPDRRARMVTNQQLREQSLEVFDRTFVITGVLRTLAVLVAFVGVLSSLMALQLERTRELGVLRACGLTPGQLWRLVTQQTGLMGLTAGLLSLPTGVAMAAIMVYVINRRSFGWSLTLELSSRPLVEAVLVALVAALLAGCYPAWRMARTSPAEALREE